MAVVILLAAAVLSSCSVETGPTATGAPTSPQTSPESSSAESIFLPVVSTGFSPATELVSLTRFDAQRCVPRFAPSGDRFLCSVQGPALWLASLSNGLERLLLEGQTHVNAQWVDDRYVVYTPQRYRVAGNTTPYPVFLGRAPRKLD